MGRENQTPCVSNSFDSHSVITLTTERMTRFVPRQFTKDNPLPARLPRRVVRVLVVERHRGDRISSHSQHGVRRRRLRGTRRVLTFRAHESTPPHLRNSPTLA